MPLSSREQMGSVVKVPGSLPRANEGVDPLGSTIPKSTGSRSHQSPTGKGATLLSGKELLM